MESLAERKLRRKVASYEIHELMKNKRSEEMDSLEEVFDRSTLMIIYRMLNRGTIKNIFGVLRSGKEARIYWGYGKRKETIAIKFFLRPQENSREDVSLMCEEMSDSRTREVTHVLS